MEREQDRGNRSCFISRILRAWLAHRTLPIWAALLAALLTLPSLRAVTPSASATAMATPLCWDRSPKGPASKRRASAG